MNNLRKVLLALFCLGMIIPYGIAQKKKGMPIKTFYAVEANFGASFRKEMPWRNIDDAKLSYKTVVYGANFMGGIELKHYFKAGLGIGYLYYKQEDDNSVSYNFDIIVTPEFITTHGIPLFLYLRSDFLDKKTSPYMDLKIGNNFLITKEVGGIYPAFMVYEYEKFRLKNGLHLTSNIGITYKIDSKNAINVSVGYRYISRNCDLYNGDIYVKSAYTIADHQFLLNLGVSF